MTIAERIIEVVTSLCAGNKSDFARRIGVTPAYISKLSKNPDCVPSDLTINAISREFKVNEQWLRTGEGEMLAGNSETAQLFDWIGDTLAAGTTEESFQYRTLQLLQQLKPEHWKVLEEIAQMIYEDEKKRRGE